MKRNSREIELVQQLKNHHLVIATAESCTGGLLAATIINVPGVSDCLNESYITYSNEAKIRILNVNPNTLKIYGAVSKECVEEMAKNLKKISSSDLAVSISGIAGPDGGSAEKPVGTVHIGIVVKDQFFHYQEWFQGSRFDVRQQTVEYAIEKLIELIQNSFM